MKKPLFTQTCTALVTPFLDGKINYPMLEVLLRRQIEAGVQAVVIAGTTGESPTLTDAEKMELFQHAKSYAANRIKIIAGTGSNSTEHTVTLSKAAQDLGVDGLLIVSPYYNKPTPEGLKSHFLTVAKSVDIPVIIYNVPSRTGVDIPVSVYETLSKLQNIAGVKEASADITKTGQIISACGPDLPVWSGNDDMTVPVISLGGYGVISVLSNLFPNLVQSMTQAAIDGDFDTAAALQSRMHSLNKLLFIESNPIPVKAAMKLIGYDCGDCRLPLTKLSAEYENRIRQWLLQQGKQVIT